MAVRAVGMGGAGRASKLIKFYRTPLPLVQERLDAHASGAINPGAGVTSAANLIKEGAHAKWKWSAAVLDRRYLATLYPPIGRYWYGSHRVNL